jgi:hypothetical protein
MVDTHAHRLGHEGLKVPLKGLVQAEGSVTADNVGASETNEL